MFLLMLENILKFKVGMETEGFAIYDAMMQLKNEVWLLQNIYLPLEPLYPIFCTSNFYNLLGHLCSIFLTNMGITSSG